MRPYTICLMAASIDGRIDCAMTEVIGGDEYYETLEKIGAGAEINGRMTAQMHYAQPERFAPEDNSPIGKLSWAVNEKSANYHVVLDTLGCLQYEKADIYGVPALIVISEAASKAYTRYLNDKGISWIAIGKDRIDLNAAMQILHDEFGIQRAVVTGGGHINGAFLQASLLDEVIMQFNPGIDGRKGWTAAFDGIEDQDFGPVKLKLQEVKQFENGTVELRYTL